MVKIVDNYTLTKVIGQGQYGKVYKATHIDTKMDVAIKVIKIEKFQEISKLTDCLKNEIQTLMIIQDNMNIIKFVEMIKTANHIYLVYEYCEGGTLQQQIRNYKFFSQKKALLYFKQLLNSFKALSQNFILHRDIKPDNILIKSGHLKLADFGFCKRMSSLDDLTQTVLGSPIYMAPEVLNGDLYNSKAEIWSLGVVLYEMLFGFCPFNEGSMADFLKHIDNFRIQIPVQINPISSITEGLLRRMIQKQQFRRISWQDLFYEYDVNQYGVLNRKQKGFQYDLMKLMKKNGMNNNHSNNNQVPEVKLTKQISFKFNWDKITDGKSSIRSEQLEQYQKTGNIDRIVSLKRKLKQFTIEHSKCYQSSTILTQVVKRKHTQFTQIIAYFISHSLKTALENLHKNLEKFEIENYSYLQINNNENEQIKKLIAVITEQKSEVITKLNSIKLIVYTNEKINKEIFKFNSQPKIRKKYLQKFLNSFNQKYPHFQSFENYELDKSITAHILRVLIALNNPNEKDATIVNQNWEKIKLVKMLHMRKRMLDI